MPPPPLPSPRALLTSLISTTASPTPPPPPPTADPPPPANHPGAPPAREQAGAPAPNPLRDAPPEKAALLSTLHVLFPSLLLPALDLLDRGLVTRVLRRCAATEGSGGGAEGVAGVRGGDGSGGSDDDGGGEGAGDGGFYIVRSANTSPRSRETRWYLVLPDAWNCTCPAFTFEAFPPTMPPPPAADHPPSAVPLTRTEGGRPAEAWSFGGMSGGSAAPPCCKHLLACVLAGRWEVLAGYVGVRRVGRGEMAGLVGDV